MKTSIKLLAILLLIATSFNPLLAQTQIGQDIPGASVGSTAGTAVSLSFDGRRVAVGEAANGDYVGLVRIYDLIGGVWTQVGQNIYGTLRGSGLGSSISLSPDGNRVAIGAPVIDGVTNSGLVSVYELVGGSWVQLGADILGEFRGDRSGISISLSSDGQRLAIGARNNAGAGAIAAGHVRIFEWINGSWTQVGTDINGESVYNVSGSSVSLSSDGSRVAIGAPGNSDNGQASGHVRIYELTGGDWVQVGGDIDGEYANDESGRSVSISADGNRVAIGAPYNLGSGHVRVYELMNGNWVQMGVDIQGTFYDNLGGSVALSADGNSLSVVANPNSVGSTPTPNGYVRTYEWIGGEWVQVSLDITGKIDALGQLPLSVSIAGNGNSVAVGEPKGDPNYTGRVRVFSKLALFPVELADFKAKALNRTALLKWTTASESNNRGFDIEHSTDGTTWQQLDFVRGQGTSSITNEYTYTHTNPANSINYYRLKQLDFDGAFEYSEVVSVHISSRDIVEVFPNPTHGIITISGIGYDTAKITDTSGRSALIIEDARPTIDISHLASGIYFIEIVSSNSRMIKKIVKK